MPYDHAITQKCLAAIKSISPEIELVRTEVFRLKGSQPQQQFTLVRANGRIELRMPEAGQLSDEDQQRLRAFLKIDSDQAASLVTRLTSLYALNHCGTWVVSPAPAPDLVIGGQSRSLFENEDSLLAKAHESLAGALPGVHEIRVESCVHLVSSGGMGRRPCVRVMATDELELAAIDATLFPVHLQALLLPREFARAHHRYRVAAWASQLATGVDLMARVLGDLSLLAVSLPVTRIVLRPATQTITYWKNRGLRLATMFALALPIDNLELLAVC